MKLQLNSGLQIQKDFDLQDHNTLAVPSVAHYYSEAKSLTELRELLNWALQNKQPVNVIGGGSNIILKSVVAGLTIKPCFSGRECLTENKADQNEMVLDFGAGETWSNIVGWCVTNGYYGIENLALIPGLIGAAPIQILPRQTNITRVISLFFIVML